MNHHAGEHRQTQGREPAEPPHLSTAAEEKSDQGQIPYAVIWRDGEELLLF